MKNKLEAELISIAHRVLKLKGKSEIAQLQKEARELYEKLTVLRFAEQQLSDDAPTIASLSEIEEKLENFTAESEDFTTETSEEPQEMISFSEEKEEEIPVSEVEETPLEDEKPQEIISEVKEEIADAAEKLLSFEDFEASLTQAKPGKSTNQQIIFEDFLPQEEEPVFVPVQAEKTKKAEKETVMAKPKSVSINDAVKKNFNIGLNDKIAFEFHLFGGSSEDFNRVLSQLNTFSNFDEAKDFIENLVKPDYNNWENKSEFEVRFMEIIESNFM
ncbi:MAG: hypothetical protein WCY89_08310 [Flavobacteriaceae bacterium]